MRQCSFEESYKAEDGTYTTSTCMKEATILSGPEYGLCSTCAYDKVKAQLEAHRWISVDERLPEAGERILIKWVRDDIKPCVDTAGKTWPDPEAYTHWKPIILP